MSKFLTVAFRKRNQLVDFTYSYLHLVDLGLLIFMFSIYVRVAKKYREKDGLKCMCFLSQETNFVQYSSVLCGHLLPATVLTDVKVNLSPSTGNSCQTPSS